MEAMRLAIIKTISYFSIFKYPLTKLELWQLLYWENSDEPKFDLFQLTLADLIACGLIASHQGFVFLHGCEECIASRQENYQFSFKKYERTRRVGRMLAFIPFVLAIFVCNSLAYNNSRSSGDIDLFVVCKPKRLWLSRMLVVGLLKLFRMRPTNKNKQDKFDPTFFINFEQLNLESVAFKPDIYLQYWLAQLSPLYDPTAILLKIRQENKNLLKSLPNSLPVMPQRRRLIKNGMLIKFVRFKWRWLFDYNCLEKLCCWWQLKIMPAALKNQINISRGVVINKAMIKLHKHDCRQEYQKLWQCQTDKLINQYEKQIV
jgi:hypothetical protein